MQRAQPFVTSLGPGCRCLIGLQSFNLNFAHSEQKYRPETYVYINTYIFFLPMHYFNLFNKQPCVKAFGASVFLEEKTRTEKATAEQWKLVPFI